MQEGITIAQKPLKEHLEAIGHRDAFLYMMQLAGTDEPLSERVIKGIHSLILINDRENKGIYRRIGVMIMGAEHQPPEPFLVPVQMERLVGDYPAIREQHHILEAVAALHVRFESIHPFIDGNGRTGRLLLNFELIKAGLLPVNIKFADRAAYYDAFDQCRHAGNYDAMTCLIAGYEAEELQRYIHIIES